MAEIPIDPKAVAEEDGPLLDLNDPVKVRQRNKKLDARAELRQRFVRAILARREGREWFWDLMTRTHIYQTSFSEDALKMAFLEGQREVGLYLLAQVPPDAMKQLMEESAEYG